MKDNLFAYIMNRIKHFFFPNTIVYAHSKNIVIENDVKVAMRDGLMISINVYRPNDNDPHPILISFHPYGKDALPKKKLFGYSMPLQYRLIRQTGDVKYSDLTSWEAPDPDFWVEQGYVVINGDMRGTHKSPGTLNLLLDQEAEDYYDLIEWSAKQSWSNGKVGLCGVSYLALSQYKVAGLQPPHLAAICVWEGFSDLYQDLARPGGIREDGFFYAWATVVEPSLRASQLNHVKRDAWWLTHIPDLKRITVPALICASFSDQCLHTGGSFRAFNEISSTHKWLYTHRSGKWSVFYSDEVKALQLKFFDYFLKDKQNDFLSEPTVRLEVHTSRDQIFRISHETTWPIKGTKKQKLYLNVADDKLQFDSATKESRKLFALKNGNLTLNFIINHDMQIIGPMKLHLFAAVKDAEDMNVFVSIHKFHNGKEVFFEGSYGYGYDVVTKGYLKASLRNIHPDAAIFSEQHFLKPGEIVKLDIELLPSATFFAQGDELQLVIQGNWMFKFNPLLSQIARYERTTRGYGTIYSGGQYQSYLEFDYINN